MKTKNFVCIRLAPSSKMTNKAAVAQMCHDIRATRPGYLRDDPDAKCYWFPEKTKGVWKMNIAPPSVKEVREHIHKLIEKMKKRYEETPRGKDGHFQKAKNNTRWFMQGIIVFSKDQLEEVSLFDIITTSTSFLDALAKKLKTRVVWAGFHDDETTLHLQFGLENLDSEGHTIQRRINKRVNESERNHLMTTAELQDMAGEHFSKLGFRRGISRDVTGAKHKEVRDVFRIEQAAMTEKKGALVSALIDLYDGKNVVSDQIKEGKKKISRLQEKREKLNDKTREMEEVNKRIEEDLEHKRTEAEAEKQFFEGEVEKYRRIRESKKALKLATLAELEKRDRASEEEVASIAREYGIEKTLKFFKRLSKHADGYFTLQTMHRRFYSGTEVWGMPERVSVADFITHYSEMKEKNMLGYEYKLSLVGAPSLFCLDGVDKAHLVRMRADGMAPFGVLELSPGSYQIWIELKSDDKNISYGAWRSINDYLANKYDAQKRSGHNTPSCAFPGFLSYSGGSKGILVALDLPEETLGKPKKTVADLMAEMSKSINKAPSTDIRTADTTYIPDSGGVDGIPGWFIEKWYEDRSDLINSKKCPKRNDGTPDDSLIDFVVAKNLIAYYKNHRPEVVRERIDYCCVMLVKEANDPHRLHRKKDPCGYAKRTINVVLKNLGLTDLMHEDAHKDYRR